MSQATFLIGDVFAVMATLPDASVDLVMTSPPFLALRSYLPEGHPDKHLEIGSEPTPAEFIDTLLALTAEWGRLLAPHGSICVELGDTYSGSGGAGGDYGEGGLRDGQGKFEGSNSRRGKVVDHDSGRRNPGNGWPLAKSMCGIPHLYHLSLAYGRNILTGKESPAGMWRVRNVVAWCRPNPPVGALGDKFRPATSYLTIATKAQDRYFDLDAVRSPAVPENERTTWNQQGPKQREWSREEGKGRERFTHRTTNPAGAPPLDYWEIPTKGYPGSHYAVYPPTLLERPLKSMVPRKVCTTCGEPSRRITKQTDEYAKHRAQFDYSGEGDARLKEGQGRSGRRGSDRTPADWETVGWTDCGHDTWRKGLVLDPFGGSGTTAAVATGLSRDAILIDLDERNANLARDRVGMFLTVEDRRPKAAS